MRGRGAQVVDKEADADRDCQQNQKTDENLANGEVFGRDFRNELIVAGDQVVRDQASQENDQENQAVCAGKLVMVLEEGLRGQSRDQRKDEKEEPAGPEIGKEQANGK